MTGEEQVRFFKEDGIMAMEITNNYSNVEQANAEKEMQAKAARKESEKRSTYGSRRSWKERKTAGSMILL